MLISLCSKDHHYLKEIYHVLIEEYMERLDYLSSHEIIKNIANKSRKFRTQKLKHII